MAFASVFAGFDADKLALGHPALLEPDFAVRQRKERVVTAYAHVVTRMKPGAALANQDVAGQNRLTTITLYTQVLGIGIAAITRSAACLFMCLCSIPPGSLFALAL